MNGQTQETKRKTRWRGNPGAEETNKRFITPLSDAYGVLCNSHVDWADLHGLMAKETHEHQTDFPLFPPARPVRRCLKSCVNYLLLPPFFSTPWDCVTRTPVFADILSRPGLPVRSSGESAACESPSVRCRDNECH